MTTLHLRTSIGRSPLPLGLPRVQRIWIIRGFLLIPILFGCFALSQTARAVSPAPDGGYPFANTAEGTGALQNLSTGVWNTANGFQTLFHDTTGGQNIAIGVQALFTNTTGGSNLATGIQALYNNTGGSKNTATGFQALFSNQTGATNVAEGYRALLKNTADDNTAIGAFSLLSNTTGTLNTAVGRNALRNNLTGTDNIALGRDAGTDPGIGSSNIYISDKGFAGDNNVIAIGAISATGTAYAKCFIGGIFGTTVTGSAVQVGSDGQLGVATSSKRFKDDIKPMDRASESILALQPVTFRYKKEIDAGSAPQFGLVAEEVAEVNPDLVIYRDGQPYTVRYDQVNAMLLNEFLKEHRKVEQLQLTLAQQQKEMRTVLARLKKQESQIQKVSAQLEVNKAAPRKVVSNQ